MRRRFIVFGIFIAALLSCVSWKSTTAAVHHNTSSWSQRDCAVYVISTMNLLHFRSGHSLTSALAQRFGVTHYDVYADQRTRDLYFIEPRTDGGSSVGAFAYEMGWPVPMSVASSLDKLHVRHAPSGIFSDYRADAKQLIGSFTSTLPS
jgi:hypothetical protein